MKRFVVFYRRNEQGGFDELCGSDSIMYLDGRWCTFTCHHEARNHIRKLRNVKRIDGYRLARGSISDPFFLTANVHSVE